MALVLAVDSVVGFVMCGFVGMGSSHVVGIRRRRRPGQPRVAATKTTLSPLVAVIVPLNYVGHYVLHQLPH